MNDYTTVPAGKYRCRVADVRISTTRARDERWSMRLVVADGPHVGKTAAWDSLVFSIRGKARACMVLQVLGLPSEWRVPIDPSDIEGREAVVEVRPVEYRTASDVVVRRNEVPFDGWQAVTP